VSNSILCLVYLLMFYFPDDKSTRAKLPPNEGFQEIKMEGPFGGLGGERFVRCGTPMSIRSIEIQYESDPTPLIWTRKVEQEYKATTVFG
jgi:hypothetical protein